MLQRTPEQHHRRIAAGLRGLGRSKRNLIRPPVGKVGGYVFEADVDPGEGSRALTLSAPDGRSDVFCESGCSACRTRDGDGGTCESIG